MKRLLSWLGVSNSKVDIGYHPMLIQVTTLPTFSMGRWIGSAVEGRDSLTTNNAEDSAFYQAERKFRRDLPGLLEKPGLDGRWMLYSAEGCVDQSDDEQYMYSNYREQIGTTLFLGRVQPIVVDAEVTSNWTVAVAPTNVCGRNR